MKTNVTYRRDIDGLRAIAVLPVVLFHAHIGLFSGGFVGVDIFFVISGFLITQIIAAEIQAGNFSIASFYERRIRRIFPALFSVLLLSTLLAIALMAPSELVSYGKRMFATIFFLANIKFLRESDYFASESEVNPLLHMWSLSVEEQFYVFFPLLLIMLFRLKLRPMTTVAGIFVFSLALSCWSLQKYPVETFFLLPTRAWELLIGSMLALMPRQKHLSPATSEILAWIGLALIGYSIFWFTEETPFPGFNALFPCIGTALLLYCGGGSEAYKTWVTKFLSLGPMVYIGLISYSLYLFHWPLIVYTNYVFPSEEKFTWAIAMAVAASVILAILSLKFVETPFRKKQLVKTRNTVFKYGAASMGTLACVTVALVVAKGLPGRYDLDNGFYDGIEQIRGVAKEKYRWGACFFDTSRPYQNNDVTACMSNPGTNDTLLIGDSHSAHLYPGLSSHWKAAQISFLSAAGCRPLANKVTKDNESCHFAHAFWFNVAVPSRHWHQIILAGQWKVADIEELRATVTRLKPHTNHLILVGPSVEYSGMFPELLAVHGNNGFLRKKMKADRFELNALMKDFAPQQGVHYVSMTDIICPNDSCVHKTPEGEYLIWDYGHLTLGGSQWVVQRWPEDIAHLGTR